MDQTHCAGLLFKGKTVTEVRACACKYVYGCFLYTCVLIDESVSLCQSECRNKDLLEELIINNRCTDIIIKVKELIPRDSIPLRWRLAR